MAETAKCLNESCNRQTGSSTGYCTNCAKRECKVCKRKFRIKINNYSMLCNLCATNKRKRDKRKAEEGAFL